MNVLQDYRENGGKVYVRTATESEIALGTSDEVLVTLSDVKNMIDLFAIFSPNLDGGKVDSNYGASPIIDGGDVSGS